MTSGSDPNGPRPREASSAPRRPRGRPRSTTARAAAISAAIELLAEGGYERLTMDAVAARSGVAKTTLYRRWPSRIDLLLDVAREVAAQVTVRATGDVRADLVALLRDIIVVLNQPMSRRLIARVLAEAREREELHAALAEFWSERRALMWTLLADAQRTGDLAGDVDLDLAADALYGPIYYRYLVTGAPLHASLAESIVDQALAGLRPRIGRPRRPE